MKSGLVYNIKEAAAIGTTLICLASTVSCAGHQAANENYSLRRQLQKYGEFHGQPVQDVRLELLRKLQIEQAKGNLPREMNVNQYYDWLKEQEANQKSSAGH